ncbi:AMP-binding protein [Streptomyces sp. NPDC047000]|uniref:class I adenylate-forming enzyme family protein n=1 Tax=Streptomyces sp. NPDC047000 TaxID=3155474 RepID=UPI0033C32A9B
MPRAVNAMPISEKLTELAAEAPDFPAIIEVAAGRSSREVTYRCLVDDVRGIADLLRAWNRDLNGAAVVCHPATVSIETTKIILAALCAGVTVLPYAPQLDAEALSGALGNAGLSTRTRYLRVPGSSSSEPGRESAATVHLTRWEHTTEHRRPRYLLTTSGSTGVPKIVPFWNLGDYDPRTIPDLVFRACGWRSGQRQLITLPIHHIGTVAALVQGVLDRNQIVLAKPMEPEDLLNTIADHRIGWLMVTPHYMKALLPAATRDPQRLKSLTGILHTALPCPAPLKQAWIDLLGGERVFEMYGGTEGVGVTVINGSEWLAKPGSVGRGLLTHLRIGDVPGQAQGAGGIGRIYLRRLGAAGRARSAAPWLRHTDDGYVSLGDMGWLDEDGYLYVFDRAANRAATSSGVMWLGRLSLVLRTHPDVLDAECVALTGAERDTTGALLVLRDSVAELDLPAIQSFCASRIKDHELPEVCIRVTEIPRSEIGKPDAVAIRKIFDRKGFRATGA